jgi:hypothetical protein
MALTLAERFWAKVSVGEPDACWPWRGARHDNGYGVLRVAHKNLRAHRIALALTGQEVPSDMDVLHSCHNPCCVNPRHLRLGTPTENAEDARAAGRLSQGERHPISRLTAEQVLEVRALGAKCAGIRRGSKTTGKLSQRALAQRYGVSRGAIDHILRGDNWKGLDTWH